MKRPVFNTNVFLSYRKQMSKNDIATMKMSVVVLYELTATTNDKSDRQRYEGWKKQFSEKGKLLVPTMSDWWEAAKIVARIRYGDKIAGHGKTPPMPEAQRLQNDVLIARSAALHDCFVVTSNTAIF